MRITSSHAEQLERRSLLAVDISAEGVSVATESVYGNAHFPVILNVDVTVKNVGTTTTSSNQVWVKVVLSNDAVIGNLDDRPQAVFWGYVGAPLSPGELFRETRSVQWPGAGVAPGTYHVGVQVATLGDANATNDRRITPAASVEVVAQPLPSNGVFAATDGDDVMTFEVSESGISG